MTIKLEASKRLQVTAAKVEDPDFPVIHQIREVLGAKAVKFTGVTGDKPVQYEYNIKGSAEGSKITGWAYVSDKGKFIDGELVTNGDEVVHLHDLKKSIKSLRADLDDITKREQDINCLLSLVE